ncbi:MAG: winged helix-turn-helix domain-containing protein [Acidobacteriia bacterium]|nr:winged helix-turn-helix domain-containing protein [Terriglobia bacterium]
MPPATNARLYRFGIYQADLRSGELRKNGAKLKLQEQPFQVLAMLLERPDEVVTREELRQRLWPADTFVDFDHSLNTAINKLRDALGDSAANPRFIETMAKRGYRFIAPVQATTVQNEAIAPPLSLPGEPAPTRSQGERQGGDVLKSAVRPPDAPPTAEECAVAVARAESRPPAAEAELPKIDRTVGRALLVLLQVMYLCFYVASLAKLHHIGQIAESAIPAWNWLLVIMVIVAAVLGIPTRLYLLTAVLFDVRKLGANFRRLFPFLFVLDELWALAPFLLVDHIGFGLAFAATAALLYVPFSQRTLIRMTYSAGQ